MSQVHLPPPELSETPHHYPLRKKLDQRSSTMVVPGSEEGRNKARGWKLGGEIPVSTGNSELTVHPASGPQAWAAELLLGERGRSSRQEGTEWRERPNTLPSGVPSNMTRPFPVWQLFYETYDSVQPTHAHRTCKCLFSTLLLHSNRQASITRCLMKKTTKPKITPITTSTSTTSTKPGSRIQWKDTMQRTEGNFRGTLMSSEMTLYLKLE